ncbi:MAG: glycosyltransferase family 4 protein [Arachnia propionica]|uniref:glycosyltransferase family 4 protein n=1 Tax=Arachnia propionica TaxID=1750 RepID=UPI00271081D7|nr:glycosyltransferase family 4 protein [Arachnia propionica]
MRVAYVSVDPGIPVFGTKGASVHVQEVIRELLSRGHQVRVHTTRRGDRVPADLTGLEVVELPMTSHEPAAREQEQRQASAEIARRVLADGADLVYERYSLFSTVIAELAGSAGIPGILEVNAPLIEEQGNHRSLVDEAAASRALVAQAEAASAVICVSDPVRDWVLERVPAARAHTVPNGVSLTRIRPQLEAPGEVVVTFVGTLKPWHGVSDLIQAASLAKQPWRVRIIGDGPERDNLIAQAEALGVKVDFRGAVAPSEMPEHLAGSAIGVAPYPDLGGGNTQYFSPLKVYEYLAAGLPVVASAVGQVPEIIADCGVLVPPSDPAALASAIDDLAADPLLRGQLGGRARCAAEQRHSWEAAVTRILRLAGVEAMHG